MASRSRKSNHHIPGYDETRPSREDRKQQHRATRHATHQMLHALDDPDEVVLPEEKKTPVKTPVPVAATIPPEPQKRRFKVWKTKFWKRRDTYRDEKARLDSEWPVITPDQLGPG